MKQTQIKLVSLVVVMILASLACSASTANISDAYMAFDENGDNPTTSFSQSDDLYAIIVLANAPDETKLGVEWVAQDVDGYDPDFFIDSAETVDNSGQFYFFLTNTDLWPTGTYRVDIYLNDELDQSINFTVR